MDWQISAGFDAESRDKVTRQAQEKNLLPNNAGSQYLLNQTTDEGKVIGQLIGFDKTADPDETVTTNVSASSRLREALKKARTMSQAEAVELMRQCDIDPGNIPSESIREEKVRKQEEEAARREELERQVEFLLAQAKERYQA